MYYTAKYAHLQEPSHLKIGDTVRYGDLLGIIGSTGQSKGRHLHLDCVEGQHPFIWTLANMEHGIVTPAYKQLNYFVDEYLLDAPFIITAYFNDYRYQKLLGKAHLAYDIIGVTVSAWNVYWNRTKPGTITGNRFHGGYGNTLLVEFEA